MNLEGLILEAIRGTKRFLEMKGADIVISAFSGGKDSLVSTIITQKACEEVGVEFRVVFIDTTCSLPTTIEYVKEISKRMGWNLDIIRPERTFWELVIENGAPTPRRRWCCQELKIKPLKRYLEKLKGIKVVALGLRNGESYRRKKVKKWWWSKDLKAWMYNPIREWSERNVNALIKKENIPINPNYDLIDSAGDCFCVCFSTIKKIKKVVENYLEFFMKIVEIEKKFRNGGSFFYIAGRKYYASDFLTKTRQTTLSDFIEI